MQRIVQIDTYALPVIDREQRVLCVRLHDPDLDPRHGRIFLVIADRGDSEPEFPNRISDVDALAYKDRGIGIERLQGARVEVIMMTVGHVDVVYGCLYGVKTGRWVIPPLSAEA